MRVVGLTNSEQVEKPVPKKTQKVEQVEKPVLEKTKRKQKTE